MHARAGYSHVELTTVLAIVATIMVLAVPSTIVGEPDRPKRTTTQNLRLIRTAIELYVTDHGGELPGQNGDLAHSLSGYFDDRDVFPDYDWICGGTVRYVRDGQDMYGRSDKPPCWSYNLETGEIDPFEP